MKATSADQPKKATHRRTPRHFPFWTWTGRLLVLLAVILLAARLYLPVWVLKYVNQKINETPDYSGSIENVDMHLWRGAYVIRNINIFKRNGKVPVPFFSARAIDLSVQWKALFDRAFVGNIEFQQPRMSFVKGPTEAQSQAGVDQPWTETIKKLFPLRINRFHVENGEIHYRDFFSRPQVDLVVSDVYMTATNLTNSKKISKTEVATLDAEARPLRTGSLKTRVTFDPYQSDPTFDLKAEIAGIPLVKLNDLTRAYAYFDFKAGTFAGATEMNASGGKFTGYIEPAFDHMQILAVPQDMKNPVKLVWNGLLEIVGRLLRNQPKDRFATRVPLSGSFKGPRVAVLATIGNVFKNAFVQAFNAKIEVATPDAKTKEAPKD